MALKLIKNLCYRIASPFIRHIALQQNELMSLDIGGEIQRRAMKSTADYVEKKMGEVDSSDSATAVLDKVMDRVKKEGLILEFGVYSGQTINRIARRFPTRDVFGFDSFEGLPERWRDNHGVGHFKVNRLPKVQRNVGLIKGWFSDTLGDFLKKHSGPVAFLHVDSDLYSSAKTIFECLEERIGPGTFIVFDEYFNYPGWEKGEFMAFQEFVSKTGLSYRYVAYNRRHEQVGVEIE